MATPLVRKPRIHPIRISDREALNCSPKYTINCDMTEPISPINQTLRLEVHLQNHGRRRIVARETKSRLLATGMRSVRCRTYLKKWGEMDTRATKAIQNSRLLAKMMIHGQLPLIAPKLARMGSVFFSSLTTSFRLLKANKNNKTAPVA